MTGLVSVAIPVYNAGRYLNEVLAAVRAQEVDREVEIVIADLGSTDGSREIAERHRAVVETLEARAPRRGATRNRLMQLARGDNVAMITQDATPASKHWLQSLLDGFGQAPDVAAVFGPHPFAIWEGNAIDTQRLERTPEGIAAYRRFPSKLTFLSNVNCCLARWAWEQLPYGDVPYAEDQLLGRELIEAGYAKVFHPEARVLDSHDHSPVELFKRYVDEFTALRAVLGTAQSGGSGATPMRRAAAVASRARAGRPNGVPRSTLLDPDAAFDPDWPWEFVRRRYPRRDVRVEARPARNSGPITISWVVPPWKVGSGGHTAIFRLIDQLERRGHACAIYVFDSFGREKRPAHELREQIVEKFTSLRAPVFKGVDEFAPSDVCIATNWRTAWGARDLPGCGEKVYLVQDDEPQFYAASAQGLFAEETYRMGYRCIAAHTSWMADLLRSRYGLETHYFDCATDLDVYRFAGEEGREPGLIAVYARRQTGRRAVDIAFAGLLELFQRRPGIRVVLFGTRSKPSVPFPCHDLGVRTPHQLAALYRRASAGIVFSLTNMSLVGQEMMASGLPLLELNGASVMSELGEPGEHAQLVEPRPDAVADSLERILDDREMAAATARRARALVEQRTWDRAGDQVEEALFSFLSRPREPVASA
jgi:glycosyltransferase involved in cell wall biosynthesis